MSSVSNMNKAGLKILMIGLIFIIQQDARKSTFV
jgi:hypothetical protein